ncbi:MAG: hypothetical protein JWM68_3662 [Verrucomicrobiales bacterium]|nr:hypothetical protein [Verrucomicrobiales bacterium]
MFKGDRYEFGIRTVACSQCGLIFTSPRPPDDWFEKFYRYHYRQYYESVSVPDEAYLNRDWIKGRHTRNVNLLASLLPTKGTILDIGCAEGTFLDLFRREFPCWTLHGIEPSEDFSKFAVAHYGLQGVAMAKFEELSVRYLPSSFDLITASHVLEHLLSPDDFFKTARVLLKPGGLLFIDVPDAEGDVKGISNLHIGHVYHFSSGSLDQFLAKHGFTKVRAQKGDEKPIRWTFQVVARKAASLPSWKPATVDIKRIARDFRKHCQIGWTDRISKVVKPVKRSVAGLFRAPTAEAS